MRARDFVTETSDYQRRREREEAIISGQRPARRRQPAQTSDYARRREQQKKSGVAEAKKHISPSGAETTMDPGDDDYEINYGPDGGVAKFRRSQGLDVRTGSKKVTKGVAEATGDEQFDRMMGRIAQGTQLKPEEQRFIQRYDQLLDRLKQLGQVMARSPGAWAKYEKAMTSDQGMDSIYGVIQKYTGASRGELDNLDRIIDGFGTTESGLLEFGWAAKEGRWEEDIQQPWEEYKLSFSTLDEGVREGQVTERSQDPNQRSAAADQLYKMFMKFRERDFAGITPEDIKKMKQLVNVSGRGYEFWVSGTGYRNAGWMLDLAVQEYREAQARSGVMPEFTGRAPTARDMAKQIAQQTRGRYDYNFPRTWTTGYGRRYRDPEDYVVYPDRESYEDAWQWIEQKGQKVHYYDSFRTLQTAVKIGRYVLEPASITRGAFSDQPETTHQISVRSAASLNQGVRTRADITDQQAAALHDIAATRSANAMAGIRAIMDVLQGEEDLKRVIDSSKKIDPRDKAKLDAIIAAAGKTR